MGGKRAERGTLLWTHAASAPIGPFDDFVWMSRPCSFGGIGAQALQNRYN